MAIYTYRCPRCDAKAEVVQSIASYSVAPEVPVCSACLGMPAVPMERYLTPVMASMDRAPWAGYLSPLDGKTFVDSRAKEREMMAKHGVVPYQEIAPDFERNRKRVIREAVADVKESIVEATAKIDHGYRPQVESADNIIPVA